MSPTPVYKLGDYGSMKVELEGYRFTEEEWEKAQEDETRTKIIVEDALFGDILGHLIESAVPRRDDVITTLLQSMQFCDKARLAYTLGLIEKWTVQDFCRIHNIRNKWAHLAKPKFSAKEWKRDVLALSAVGSKKGQVTEENYLDFFWDTVQDCRKAVLDAFRRVNPTYMTVVDELSKVKPEETEAFLTEVERRQAEKRRKK